MALESPLPLESPLLELPLELLLPLLELPLESLLPLLELPLESLLPLLALESLPLELLSEKSFKSCNPGDCSTTGSTTGALS